MHWVCSRCGDVHDGIPLDWAFDAPTYWDGARSDDDFLSDDLCVWRDDAGDLSYFIRGVLELPIRGRAETLGYGVWSSLSQKSFERVVERWADSRGVGERYFGWLSNSIPGYPGTLNLPVDVVTREVGLRPVIELHDGDHPLVAGQRDGLEWERVREIAELHLHPR